MDGNAMQTPWNSERVEQLTQLWREGFSASQIAARLGGATRNAVIGKVHRLGLPARRMRQRDQGRPRVRLPNARRQTPKPRAWRPVPVPHLPVFPQAEPVSLGVSIVELTPNTCRWPHGDPKGEFGGFCGHPISPGSPYCPHHRRRARA